MSRRPATRRWMLPAGLLGTAVAAPGLWFLAQLVAFSSNVRDALEEAPGPLAYALLGVAALGLVTLLIASLVATVLGAKARTSRVVSRSMARPLDR